MSGFVTFEAEVEPMPWGGSTYTVVRLPRPVVAALGKARRVEGEFADHPVNLAIARAPVSEDPFVYAGKTLLTRIGLEPGQRFEARLRPADPDAVEVPGDVLQAVRSGGVGAAWEALTPGKKRGLIHGVETAKRAETRTRRIADLVRGLRDA